MSYNYWLECLECSLDSHNIQEALTKEQREAVAKDMEMSHTMHSEAHGYHNIPDPRVKEIATLEKALLVEREKVTCRECAGSGSITTHGPCHSATSICRKCSGNGRHTP
jgi:DnaJ-class molecular chaperone